MRAENRDAAAEARRGLRGRPDCARQSRCAGGAARIGPAISVACALAISPAFSASRAVNIHQRTCVARARHGSSAMASTSNRPISTTSASAAPRRRTTTGHRKMRDNHSITAFVLVGASLVKRRNVYLVRSSDLAPFRKGRTTTFLVSSVSRRCPLARCAPASGPRKDATQLERRATRARYGPIGAPCPTRSSARE